MDGNPLQQSRENETALVAQAEALKEGFSPKELEIFLHLGEYCIEKGAESYLDRQYFPVADELEDFFELLVENKILSKAGRSDRGIAGFVWKLHRANYEQVRGVLAPHTSEVFLEEKKTPEQILKDSLVARFVPQELTYFLNLPQNICIENGRMYWDFTASDVVDEHGLQLSVQEKKEISQLLIQIGVASKEKDGTVLQIEKKKYLEVWNILTGNNIEGLEKNATVLFQSLLILEQIFDGQKEKTFDETACVTLLLEQLSAQCDWKSINQKNAEDILQNLFENRSLEKSGEGNITITERGYEYLGIKKVVLQMVDEESLGESDDDERYSEFLNIEPQEIASQEDVFSVQNQFREDEKSPKIPKPERSHLGVKKRKLVEKTPEELEREANELLRKSMPISEQQEEALQRMMAQEFEGGKRELYAHQTPVVDDFVSYLQTVVESRKEKGDTENGENIDLTRARIVSAPRTGKTTIAAEIIRRSGLPAVYFVPSSNLVTQAKKELAHLLEGKKVAAYGGGVKEDLRGADVIVATYNQGLSDIRLKETLPPEILAAAIVFTDEGHESTTARKTQMLDSFHKDTLKIALSGTPDYNEERTLEKYYPYKIHELTTRDAVEMGLLAPFRYWTYEVGVDGSKVSFDHGDYSDGEIGKIMSEMPFFQFCASIRYSPNNKSTPALLVCKTQDQALELANYLRKVKPENSKRIGVVLHERGQGNTLNDNSREKKLENFENGEIDTLITVRVLLRGWDSEKCKLLIDMAPTASPVLAGQKYTRPLTKGEDESGNQLEASIYTLVPQNLQVEPILPSDVLESYGVDVEGIANSLTEFPASSKKHTFQKQVDSLPDSIDGIKMKLLVRNQEFGGLGRKNFDVKDTSVLREIILTCIDQTVSADQRQNKETFYRTLNTYLTFRNTLFNHAQFRGYGRTLLYLCGIKDQEGYRKLIEKIFPEESADILLTLNQNERYRFSKKVLDEQERNEQSVELDAEKLFEAIQKNRNRNGVWDGYRALFGEQEIEPRDPFLLSVVQKVLNELPPLWRKVLYQYYYINENQTENAIDWGMSRSRPQQIIDQVFREIRKNLLNESVKHRGKYREMRGLLGFEEPKDTNETNQNPNIQDTKKKMREDSLNFLKNILVESISEKVYLPQSDIKKQIREFVDEIVDQLTAEEQNEMYSNFVHKRIDATKSGKGRTLFGERQAEFIQKIREIEDVEQRKRMLSGLLQTNICGLFSYWNHPFNWWPGFFGKESINQRTLSSKIKEFCRQFVSKMSAEEVNSLKYAFDSQRLSGSVYVQYILERDDFINKCKKQYCVYNS